jgi:hypothetical protein
MLVKESISFQRGKNPKEILGIGYDHVMHVNDILEILKRVMIKNNNYSKIEIITQTEKEFVAGFEQVEHISKGRGEETWLYTLSYNKNNDRYVVNAFQLLPEEKYGKELSPYETPYIENVEGHLMYIMEL